MDAEFPSLYGGPPMKRPSTWLVLGSLFALLAAVTLGAFALRGGTSGGASDQVPREASDHTIAPAGSSLERLTSPPERSLWALSADAYDAGVEISVEFEPYGIGPSSHGPSIVVLVATAEPSDPSANVPDLAGRNVVLLLGDSVVDTGGRYEGTAVTRMQDDRMLLVLKDVRPLP